MQSIRPQKGFQESALSTPADIAILGGSAGAGKTYTLLLEFLRHINNPGWGGVIFRRTSPQIKNEGGLWDTSLKIYPLVGAEPRESSLEWKFKSGSKMKFSHLEYEKNVLDWQGSQIPFIGFDELTHYSESMFWYLLSRNRSVCGVAPYVRATCNPDPDSWVAKLIDWWIGEDGFPIPERSGKIRYFTRDGSDYIWGDTRQEVIEKAWYFLEKLVGDSGVKPEDFVKSLTFVGGTINDNKELLKVNPGYLANLAAMDSQTRSQLLDGNWKIVVSDNELYEYPAFLGMFDNVKDVEHKGKYITADIALKGSNKFVVLVWYGYEVVDLAIMDKSNGKQVIDTIIRLAKKHGVENRHIVYDSDGVGGFIDGFIAGSKPFNNGAPAANKENYQNLKTQCYYKSADKVNDAKYKISEQVAGMMYDEKTTIRQRFIQERKVIKRDKADMDGKLQIISKDKMKVMLSGDSPDMLDSFCMREYFDLQPAKQWVIV